MVVCRDEDSESCLAEAGTCNVQSRAAVVSAARISLQCSMTLRGAAADSAAAG